MSTSAARTGACCWSKPRMLANSCPSGNAPATRCAHSTASAVLPTPAGPASTPIAAVSPGGSSFVSQASSSSRPANPDGALGSCAGTSTPTFGVTTGSLLSSSRVVSSRRTRACSSRSCGPGSMPSSSDARCANRWYASSAVARRSARYRATMTCATSRSRNGCASISWVSSPMISWWRPISSCASNRASRIASRSSVSSGAETRPPRSASAGPRQSALASSSRSARRVAGTPRALASSARATVTSISESSTIRRYPGGWVRICASAPTSEKRCRSRET